MWKNMKRILLTLAVIEIFSIIHLVQPQNQDGFISLDCGMPIDESPYTDPDSGLVFTSDSVVIQTGESGRVEKAFDNIHIKPYLVMRYFPEGLRNCYTLNVTRNTTYHIGAMFLYGNYDGLNTYPNFDLYLGPNKWETIDLERYKNGTWVGMIHTPRSSSLEMCLVKTGTTFPLISTIEIRPFGNNTYGPRPGSLSTLRYFFNDTSSNIRYPHDIHDRIWSPYYHEYLEWRIINTTFSISSPGIYETPKLALATAATPLNDSLPLEIYWSTKPPTAAVYVYLHFAEIQALRANETREFDIYFNENSNYSAFSPPKLEQRTITFSTVQCPEGFCSLRLVRTKKSTLPPLINAIEAFSIIEFPFAETNPSDVSAIKNIKDTYRLSKISWQGDPCVPQDVFWEHLKCNYTEISSPPRITSLNLSSQGLTGIIVPSIQNLTQLQELDLSNNTLTGEVPKYLAKMKSLLVINLSKNKLSGSIPQALLDRQNDGLLLIYQENPELCRVNSCIVKEKKKFLVPVVASVASVVVIIVISLLIFVIRKKMQPTKSGTVEDSGDSYESEPSFLTKNRRFTHDEVTTMTNNFQRVLGEGGFGVVYHGLINGAEQIAVKVLSQSSAQGYKQFKAEVELLLRVHHINLVNLVGYCDEGEHLGLIYEYMPNGDLKQHLSGKWSGSVLSWKTRLIITVDAAQGLEYLHTGCKPAMVHRDVKSSNILLDEHFQAKLADFGLSRSFPTANETYVSTVVAGTPGYLDPEYYQTNWLSEKSDVYSFGIVLLEIITNRPIIQHAREKTHIVEWVGLMLQKGDIRSIIDPNLQQDYDSGSVWKALELAMSCVNPSSARRPNMSRVVNDLKDCLAYDTSRRGGSVDMDSKGSVDVSMNFGTEGIPKAR
ncbi:PREDICTED: probable leucine-rich repeat receptor-like protein kinase At2g28990 isoform X2 [Camelina sativa]|uniref:non-specific serine/threonine protein kinase n=1 Tax=Camelina sativa TaxID=90675 RepID=A0ABM1RPS8_CAMSA|nr:PREDICTED: probable leucine-rich repeat receptor-like protein kinase At2g28990 isoform X2 [Camelina sativa]